MLHRARMALPLVEGAGPGVRCVTGDAKLTIGGDLKARYVSHAVGPNYLFAASLEEGDRLLTSAYRRALETCAEHNATLARGGAAGEKEEKEEEEEGAPITYPYLGGFDDSPRPITRIAFALISAGVYRGGKSRHDVLKLGVEAIRANCPDDVEEVHMVGFSKEEVDILQDVASDVMAA